MSNNETLETVLRARPVISRTHQNIEKYGVPDSENQLEVVDVEERG
jgi:hypothetical protein